MTIEEIVEKGVAKTFALGCIHTGTNTLCRQCVRAACLAVATATLKHAAWCVEHDARCQLETDGDYTCHASCPRKIIRALADPRPEGSEGR